MGNIEHSYGFHRCRDCGVQRSEGPSCGACGAPNSRREWVQAVPAADYRGAVDLDRDSAAALIVVVDAVIEGRLGVRALAEVRDRLTFAIGGQ